MAPRLVALLATVAFARACTTPPRPMDGRSVGGSSARRVRVPQMPPSVGAPVSDDGADGEEDEWPADDPAYQQAPLHTAELVFPGGGGRPARAYLAVHKASMAESNKGIVLLSDIYGWAHPNTRAAAERLAASCEAFVLVPDVFRGQAWPEGTPSTGPGYENWRSRFPLVDLAGDINGCAQYLNSEHGVELLGILGFCWGGGRALELAAREWVDAHAVAVFYPTRFDVERVAQRMQLPLLAVYAGEDTIPGATQTDAAGLEAALARNPRMRQHYFVRSFAGRAHAFAHRPRDDDDELRDADAALKLAEAWFDKYLHESLLPVPQAQPHPPPQQRSAGDSAAASKG